MIAILKSQVATLVVLALALLAQLPHATEVFVQAGQVSGVWGWLHGASYAIALELAVLLFVVQGRRKESYGFAAVSVLVNLAYYSSKYSLFTMQALPAWLISLALPVAIALYSHAIADDDVQVDWSAMWLRISQVAQLGYGKVRTEVTTPRLVNVQPLQVAEGETLQPQEIAVQLKRNDGLSNAAIAERLQVHVSTVGRWLKAEGVAA